MPQFTHRVRRRTLSSLLTLIVASPVIASPVLAADPAPAVTSFHATNVLGTSLDLKVVASTQAEAEAVHAAVMAEIERLRALLSTRDPQSHLGKVNGTSDPVQVSSEVLEVLGLYEQWSTRTGGAFSAGTAAMSGLWKSAEKEGVLPSAERLAAEVSEGRKPLWRIQEQNGTVRRTGARTINIDSLGKGFIVSRAAEAGKRAVPKIRGLLLNIGGDIATIGFGDARADDPWQVAITDPAQSADNAPPLTVLKLSNLTAATSGHYARGYEIGGKKYSHIIDPRTASPVNAGETGPVVASATVLAPGNAVANALATSLCVMKPEEGLALVNGTRDAEALIVLSDGRQLRSNGFHRFEVAPPKDSLAAGWEDGYQVSVELQLKPITGRRPERAYVAIWVEDSNGKHVITLAEWGNNSRWISSLTSWIRSINNDRDLQKNVTRATRPAGNYTIEWDGRDQKGNPVPRGVYKVFVETAYEHNGHSVGSATITCGTEGADARLEESQHFGGVPVVFARKKP